MEVVDLEKFLEIMSIFQNSEYLSSIGMLVSLSILHAYSPSALNSSCVFPYEQLSLQVLFCLASQSMNCITSQCSTCYVSGTHPASYCRNSKFLHDILKTSVTYYQYYY